MFLLYHYIEDKTFTFNNWNDAFNFFLSEELSHILCYPQLYKQLKNSDTTEIMHQYGYQIIEQSDLCYELNQLKICHQ